MWIRGHSTSLKMVPFASLGMLSYLPSIVTISVSVAISQILNYSASKNGLTLKYGFGVVRGHLKWHSSIDHVRRYIGSPL